MRSPVVLRVLVQLNHFVPSFSHSDPPFPQKGKKKVSMEIISKWYDGIKYSTHIQVEHSHKNLLGNYFLNLGKKDLMETAATRNVQKKWQI